VKDVIAEALVDLDHFSLTIPRLWCLLVSKPTLTGTSLTILDSWYIRLSLLFLFVESSDWERSSTDVPIEAMIDWIWKIG
jgi:hypothetical protein